MRLTRTARTIGPIALVLAVAAALQACDTPVYQYSMYEWRPDRYEVRYFHRAGEPPAADAAANERLRAAGPANLSFYAVEVATDGSVAAQHASAWRGHRTSELPLHVVSLPGHGTIFAGRLDAATVGQLMDSPGRRELAGELSAGRAGVLLVLLDRAAGDDERVLQVARDAAAQAADGERTVGLVSVDRADPAERWLVRQLLAVEDDLPEIAGSMVFGAFGRGHVLPPFVGKGVTPQGMRDLIAFIQGPCACELKAANPGLDLLMSWSWDDHLPQWATASSTQPSFVLFDFTAEPESSAGPVDPDASGDEPAVASASQTSVSAERPVTDAPQTRIEPREAAGARSAQQASGAAPTRATPPPATIEQAPRPQPGEAPPAARARPAQTTAEPPASPDAQQPSPPGEPDAAPVNAAGPESPRLVARAPDLPTAGQARLASRLPAEESSFTGVLALRLGLTLLTVAAVALAGHIVLRRSGATDRSGSADSDG